MEQIYNFEQTDPPVLNENMLRQAAEKCRLRWQTALIAAAGVLLQIVVVLVGLLAMSEYPWLTALCLAYAVISATGSGVLAVIITRKGVVSYE